MLNTHINPFYYDPIILMDEALLVLQEEVTDDDVSCMFDEEISHIDAKDEGWA